MLVLHAQACDHLSCVACYLHAQALHLVVFSALQIANDQRLQSCLTDFSQRDLNSSFGPEPVRAEVVPLGAGDDDKGRRNGPMAQVRKGQLVPR